jgi:hypothetical protein
MKVSKVKPAKAVPGVVTELTSLPDNRVKIWHSQTIGQSYEFQSASCTYGFEMIVDNKRLAIRKGLAKAEGVVERNLVLKVREQKIVLRGLAKQNGKI